VSRVTCHMTIFFKTDLDEKYYPRLQYVLDWLEQHPCAPEGIHFEWSRGEEEVHFFYGRQALKGAFFVPAQGFLFSKIPRTTFTAQHFTTNALEGDVIETLFFHLSRYEEYYCSREQEDAHGMMKASEQFLSKYGLHHEPVCDKLAVAFWEAMGFRPKRLKTTYRMSHDIDVLEQFPSWYKLLRGTARIIVQREGIKAMWYHWHGFFQTRLLGKKDCYDSFDELLLSSSNIEKIIYFMTGGTTQYEGWYSIFNPKIKKIIALSRQRGYEIGIHPSYNSLNDATMMATQRATLEQVAEQNITRTRQHFLRFDMQKTPKILSSTPLLFQDKTPPQPSFKGREFRRDILIGGVSSPPPLEGEGGRLEDSTLGYRDRIGFRCGTGFPYRLYDFEQESAYHFIETPMIVMDISWRREFPNDLDRVGEELLFFLEKNKENTKITFNIHNTFFDNVVSEGRGELLHEVYQKIRQWIE
jgi:hypothetical protein